MQEATLNEALLRLRDALTRDDIPAAIAIIDDLHPADQAELITSLDEDHQQAILTKLAPSSAADIMEELDDQAAARLAGQMPTDTVIRIVDEMKPDEAADLLGDIEPEHAQAVLAGLEDPEEIHPLLLHPDDSAGGLMTSEFLALRRRMTAVEAINALRDWAPDEESAYYLFVVDAQRHLCGVVNLRQLIVAQPDTPLSDIMDPEVISVKVGTDQEECARLISHYDLLALPVVDEQTVLLGVVTIDDVVDVLEREATEDIQRMGGSEPLEGNYLLTGIMTVVRKRVGWLLLLFVTESLTGSVLRLFEHELQAEVALAFFVPLLIGTGGNAGSQTTSTIIRALAVGDVDLGDALKALWHEFRVGILLGASMAAVAFVRALLWGTTDQVALAVSVAILAIVLWANVLGSILPLLATKLKIDPTVVSGPVMSTLVDATGLFIYFTIARVVLGL